MSGWIACAKFPLDLDLSVVDQVLTEREIVHRFTEEDGHQLLWLYNAADQPAVVDLLAQWRQNGLSSHNSDFARNSQGYGLGALWLAIVAAPITCLVILLGILGAFINVYARQGGIELLSLFNFYPFEIHGNKTLVVDGFSAISNGQVWRLITPTFIHFGTLHILFNGLWVWVFGHKIERTLGTSAFVIIFVLTAVFANVVQAALYGPNIFGGLSGVVYGLLGFIWIWQWRLPESILRIQNGVIVFMLIWLILGFVGGIDFLVGQSVANGAHLGGLIAGIIAGFYSTQRVLTKTRKI